MRRCEDATTLLRVANERGPLDYRHDETSCGSAFLSAIALVKADYTAFHWRNTTIQTDVTVSTEIFLEWTAKGYTGPFTLSVLAFNDPHLRDNYTPGPFGQLPVYDSASIILAGPPSAAGGKFTRKAEPVDASGTWTGRQFLYQIDADFPDQSSSSAGAFYLADAS
ncbi:hypothetical protein GGR58DRAFT_503422 [Xylaria digitata]|nr:hypothetical protein GGR58DRAFT_503422 [Xylaria digitata]